jgi:nucleotide-binding universal stress UspA family protein
MSMSSSASAAHPVIVVGVGDDEASERALQWAVDEAGRGSMSLHLLHASPMPFRASVTAEPAAGARRLLDDAAQRVHDLDPQVEVTTATEHGRASVSLVDAAQGAELLVVGSRARSAFASAVLGSTSLDVAVHAGCPVVVVRELPAVGATGAGVVVGSDGSPGSEPAVAEGFRQADARRLPLTVVHAWQLDFAGAGWTPEDSERVRDEVAEQERALAAEAVSGWGEKYPDVELRQVVLNAHPVEALVDHSRDAELVVVGSRGRGGFRGMLLGSVSRDVLGHAHCPVMVVRSAGRS